jgi:hypothetical protein
MKKLFFLFLFGTISHLLLSQTSSWVAGTNKLYANPYSTTSVGIGTTTPNSTSRLDLKYTGSDKLTSGSRITQLTDLEIDGTNMKATLSSRLGFGSAWTTTGGNASAVLGSITSLSKINANTWTSTYAAGGTFSVILNNPTGYNSNEHIIAGTYTQLSGTISSFPANGYVTALFARDLVNVSSTWAGYFDGKVAVTSKIYSEEVIVKLKSEWADYVFDDEYKLLPLNEVAKFIDENKRLPDIPSSDDVAKNGITLGEMNAQLLKKVEELTLYLIDQNKKIESQSKEIELLKKEIVRKGE